MGEEAGGGGEADWGLVFDLGAEPDAEFKDPLEFFGAVVPAVVIAQGVGGEVVVEGMSAAGGVGEYVVGFPVGAVDGAAAEVAAAGGFAEDFGAFGFGESGATGVSWCRRGLGRSRG